MKYLTKKEKIAVEELTKELKRSYKENLRYVILYGSKARGDASEDSDIDIMVVLKDYKERKKEFDKIFEKVYKINYEHNILISVIIKKEKDYLTQKSPLLLNVRKEGVSV